eukprot:591675-Rhodomonas_salina.3
MARVPNLLQQLGRIEQALDAWGLAAQMHPEAGEAHANYGAFLAQVDRLEEAVEAYRKGLKFRPDLEVSARAFSMRCPALKTLPLVDVRH